MLSTLGPLKRRLAVLVPSAFMLLVACEQPLEVRPGGRVLQRLSYDRRHLELVYRDTKGAEWDRSDGWLSEDPIGYWYGVHPSGIGNEQVLFLYLGENNLRGGFPASVLQMTKLARLHLDRNRLTGGLPLLGWRNLSDLKELVLDQNQLSGPIPPRFGELASLEKLYVYENNLSGPIPPELGDLTDLIVLSIEENQLSGPIPPELRTIL